MELKGTVKDRDGLGRQGKEETQVPRHSGMGPAWPRPEPVREQARAETGP